MNLVVFDLKAVIDFNPAPLRECLKSAIRNKLGNSVSFDQMNWSSNCSGVLMDMFQQEHQRFPTDEEYTDTRNEFLICLKDHFKASEDYFDNRPGVQELFASIEKKQDWKFIIVSDYWSEGTKFILSSCGVYAKNKRIYTADDALSSLDLIDRAIAKYKLDKKKDNIYLMGVEPKRKSISFNKKRVHRIKPKSKKLFFYDYPKFSKLFG